MIQFSEKIFDDFIPSGTAVYTSVQTMKALGAGDQVGLFFVADQVALSGTFATVTLEHSTDGRNWSPKNASPEINNKALNVGRTVLYGGEAWPTRPGLELVRAKIQLAATFTPVAHVKLFAVVRDRGGKAPSECGCGPKEERSLSVQTELARLRAESPNEAIALLHEELGGGPATPEALRDAVARLPPEARAELTAHGQRVSALSAEARKELLKDLVDNL